MAMGILNNMASKLNGFFLEEAPCGSTGFFTRRRYAAARTQITTRMNNHIFSPISSEGSECMHLAEREKRNRTAR
jgi:hypothetical protein